jgi:Tol biopolymer transport system component/Zn-dependent M28 family amino/carboxypeptidase
MLSRFILITLMALSYYVYAENQTVDLSKKISDVKNTIVTNGKQITFVGPRSGEGYYSADGKKMVFQSEREPGNPFYQMYLLDIASGVAEKISTGSGKTTCGWVHPDGKIVMWSSTHLDKDFQSKVKEEYADREKPVKGKYSWSFDDKFEIFSSSTQGKSIKQLTRTPGYDAEGSYSPDGKTIAFASNRNAYIKKLSDDDQKKLAQDASYFMEIYLMNADGTNVRQLTDSNGYDGGPFFSADGKKITWRRFSADGMKAEIYTMNVDGSDQKPVTRLAAMSWAPFFHPSGDYIIFASSILGFANFELFIVDSEGKRNPVRVTFSEGFDGLASFSPDGETVTWSHKNEKGESQIYTAKWDDQQARTLLGLPPVKASSQLDMLASDIKLEDTKAIVKYLASEDFKGRQTGSEEEKEYTTKIAELFKKWGLRPVVGKDYVQTFEFNSGVERGEKNSANLSGRANLNLKIDQDYQVVSFSKSGKFQPAPLVFAGFGIQAPPHNDFVGFNSYKDLDVKGKWVVVLPDGPSPENRNLKLHSELVLFSGLQHKITVAKKMGAFGLIIIEEKISPMKFEGAQAESTLPVLKLSSQVFNQILEPAQIEQFKNYKSIKITFDTYDFKAGFKFDSQYLSSEVDLKMKKSTGRNVVAVLWPEKASAKKEKAVLIGAHGDHLGYGQAGSSLATGDLKGKIHYGADDNASGVAGVLELANSYASVTPSLNRPLVFAVWSGEEIGVLGSNYFVKAWKKEGFSKKDLNETYLAGLNMDMIGRFNDRIFVQGLGSAREWAQISEQASVKTKMSIATTSDPYLPTDSMALYLGKIPSISFFTGSHTAYHTPNDKPDSLNYEGLVKSIALVKEFSDELQKSKMKLTYQAVEGNTGSKLEGRSFRIFLGTIPDYSQENIKGVKISGTAKNSPAELSGLKSGDVIVEFDQTPIENIYDYVYTLQTVKPDIKTNIIVLRDAKKVALEIKPVLKE